MKTIIFDLDGTLVDLVPSTNSNQVPEIRPRISRAQLEPLRKRYNFSLVTGSCRQEALYALKQINCTDLFDQNLIVCADDIAAEKKTGAPFTVVKQQADVLCVIGDSDIHDLGGAQRAGLNCVIVKSKKDLRKTLQKL